MKSKIWKIQILLRNWSWGMVEALNSFTGPRWRKFHCLAARYVVLQMTRRASVSRVIPAVRELTGYMATSFLTCDLSVLKREMLEICEFVWAFRIFPFSAGLVASVWRVQIGKWICNAGSLLDHKVGPWGRKFGKSKICSEIEAAARLRPQSLSGVLAGANFIALRHLT